jgi:BirA family biotin operon repressor/biotin-[acetyl-CoA-carboxylase] ligase
MSNELSPEAIRQGLKTELIGKNILYYPTTSSTMDSAKQAIGEGADEGTVVLADHQTAGRGRLDREWLSVPGGGILLSIILYPDIKILPRLTMAACLAVARSIEEVTGLQPAIKWPNDVLLEGRKVSGILSESDVSGESVNYAVVGIALNVNLDTSTMPDIADTATSLKQALGREVPRQQVLVSLLQEFENLYLTLRRGESIQREWLQRLETLGKDVSVRCGDEVQDGYAESVDEEGNLIIRRPDGRLITVAAGDVTLRS